MLTALLKVSILQNVRKFISNVICVTEETFPIISFNNAMNYRECQGLRFMSRISHNGETREFRHFCWDSCCSIFSFLCNMLSILVFVLSFSLYCLLFLQYRLLVSPFSYIFLKYNIDLHSLRNRAIRLSKGCLLCLFLKVVQINFIIADNVRIFSIYFKMVYSSHKIENHTFPHCRNSSKILSENCRKRHNRSGTSNTYIHYG